MGEHNWQPNRVEWFLIGAPFWIRVLVCLFGIGVLGLMIGSADMVVNIVNYYTGGVG